MRNPNNARLGSRTIISPGFELFDDSITNQSDIIFGWLVNSTRIAEINLAETDVVRTEIPVIITSLSMTKKTGEDATEDTKIAGKNIQSESFKINLRYDRSNWSEFIGIGFRWDIELAAKWRRLAY